MTREPANQKTPLPIDPSAAVDTASAPTLAPVPGGATQRGEALEAAEPNAAHKASVARAAKAREDRLAAALRTNLSRRKAAAKASREGE
jgi:hypothetical protein